MKTNYLTLSVMALAAAFTACSQDNEIPETNVSDNAQALTIQATESGFEAADAESLRRITARPPYSRTETKWGFLSYATMGRW